MTSNTIKIDTHQHFWKRSRSDYGWLTPDLTPIYRDFLPAELRPTLSRNQIDGTILVPAADSIAETRFMLDISQQHHWVFGVVGWVPLDQTDAIHHLATFSEHPKFCTIRPMLQDIDTTRWILENAQLSAFYWLSENDIEFDALIQPRHLSVIDILATQHPNLTFIIDHSAKPDIAQGIWDERNTGVQVLAKRPSCYCKISSLITEAGDAGTLNDTIRYIQEVIRLFGAQRVIWGSDWLVGLLQTTYDG